ncbi:MAG: SPOR domain-containing protein [Pseudomonadales bacterium]
MQNLIRAIPASTLLILATLAQAADLAPTREYWVSIASFQEFENAEAAQQQASGKLTERLSITPATTPAGYVLRVVAGPYFDRLRADQVLETSRLAGYETAWIFSQEVPAITSNVSAEEYSAAESFSSTSAYSSGATVDYSDSVPVLRPNFVPPPADPARNEPVLVEEAPVNYSVHRLHRD